MILPEKLPLASTFSSLNVHFLYLYTIKFPRFLAGWTWRVVIWIPIFVTTNGIDIWQVYGWPVDQLQTL